MFPSRAVGLLSLALAGTARAALETAISVNLAGPDVLYDPQEAWFTELSTSCGTPTRYTTQVNASISFTFSGSRLQISGIGDKTSGKVALLVDNLEAHVYDLYSTSVTCEMIADYYFSEGEHNATLMLLGRSDNVNASHTGFPLFYLTELVYFAPAADEPTNFPPSATSTPSSGSLETSPSSSSHKGAIAGAVVGGVFLIGLLLGLIFFIRKRKAPWQSGGRGRHTFDPTNPKSTVYITELTPRSPRGTDFGEPTKFPSSYARMEDDEIDVKSANPFEDPDIQSTSNNNLSVPTVAYSRGKDASGGLRSRSRSPAPRRDDSA